MADVGIKKLNSAKSEDLKASARQDNILSDLKRGDCPTLELTVKFFAFGFLV